MSSEKAPAAIVTGGAQGFGRAIADALLKKGFKVCIADINESVGHQTKEDLSKRHGSANVMFVTCDVTEESHFARIFEEVLKTFGRIDLLVNNAGIACEKDPVKTLMVNLKGAMLGCKAAMKYMGKDNGGRGGSVINIASLVGLVPFYRCPYYAATKHGIVGLTRSLGTPFHYDKHGVTFSALCPGSIRTSLLNDMRASKSTEERTEHLSQKIGFMEPDFAAEGVIKLLDDQQNGATLIMTKCDGFKYVGIGEELQNVTLT